MQHGGCNTQYYGRYHPVSSSKRVSVLLWLYTYMVILKRHQTPTKFSSLTSPSPISPCKRKRSNGFRRLLPFELYSYVPFFFAGLALMCSLLTIKNTTTRPLHHPQPQNHAPSPPYVIKIDADINVIDNPLIQGNISDFIQTFQNVVQSKVNLQTASWFRHIGPFREALYAATNKSASIDDRQVTNSSRRKLQKQDYSPASIPMKKKEKSTSSSINEKATDVSALLSPTKIFLWDKESDIPMYFEQLHQACSQNAHRNHNFTSSCFVFLQSLIHEPRCTVSKRRRNIFEYNSIDLWRELTWFFFVV